MNKTKEGKVTKWLRENPWRTIAVFLSAFIVFLLFFMNYLETINYSDEKLLCSVISTTPAWVKDGKILDYGIISYENLSMDEVNEALIPNKVKMLYLSSDLDTVQINYFKNKGIWKNYTSSGLAVNCSDYL